MSGGGGGGGAGGGLITDANARLLVEDGVAGFADEDTATREVPVIDWDTDVAPPAVEAGDALVIAWSPYVLSTGRHQNVYLPSPPSFPGASDFISVGADWVPDLHPVTPTTRHIASVSGYYNTGWTYTPSEFGCGVGQGSDSGWYERERWYQGVVPAHPADLAGITFDVTIAQDTGAGGKLVNVMVRSAAPTAGRQGTIVATIPVGTSSVTIPTAYIPAEDGEIWVGFGPAWQADRELDTVQPVGYPAMCRGTGYDPGNANMTVTAFATDAWAVYTSPGGDLGTTVELDDENDPMTGGNTIVDLGSEGSGTSGVDDGAFYVDGPGGRTLGVIGEGEDEDEPYGFWADGWSVYVPFVVSPMGDEGDAQPSEIVVTTTRAGETWTGTIHLGDTGHAPGIAVASLEGSDYVPVTITPDVRWIARFDDRSDGYLRGKVWLATDGEPAEWQVEVALPDESDVEGDRLTITIRAQDGQLVRVLPVTARGHAQGGLIHERIGIASGLTDRFVTSHQFVAGTLALTFAGVFAPPVRESGPTCESWMDYRPTAGMVVWASYLAEGG